MPAMRTRLQSVVLPFEVGDFADDVRRVFAELGRASGVEGLTGECSPPLDVFESDDAVEIRVDLPGIDPAAVRVLAKGPALLIAGEKAPRRGRGDSTYHLVERGFGRFVRTVRLASPCNAGQARAQIVDGELRISIPKIADRRGRPMHVPIGVGTSAEQ
jgi:HSP20 family protein